MLIKQPLKACRSSSSACHSSVAPNPSPTAFPVVPPPNLSPTVSSCCRLGLVNRARRPQRSDARLGLRRRRCGCFEPNTEICANMLDMVNECL
nr:hypothetical protein Iba_chr02dCG6190 [Ipomoea batatas]